MIYFGARYYNPQTGRWLSPDPLGMVDGPNLYAYCSNNPVNLIDPWGLCDDSPTIDPDKPWWEDWLDEFFTAPWNIGEKALEIEREEYAGYIDPFGGDYRHFVAAAILSRQFGPLLGAAALWLHQRSESDYRDAAAEWRGWRASWRHLFTPTRRLGKDYIVRPIGK